MRSTFDKKKALNALLYVISRLPKPDTIHIVKVFYFAEKNHLETYGRLICHDDYKRMTFGPVPTRIYDLLKAIAGMGQSNFLETNPEFVKKVSGAIKQVSKQKIVALEEPNLDYLSKSDLKCLDDAISKYGQLSFKGLTDKSHDEVWKASDDFDISLEEIITSLPNKEEVLEYVNSQA